MSPAVARNRWRLAVRLTCAALIWSVGLVLAALLLPTYDGQTVSNSNGLTLTTRTAVQVHGLRALIIIAVPLAASLVVAVALYRRRIDGWRYSPALAWATISILIVVALLGIPSIGLFILPVAILLALAARLVVGPDAVRAEPVRAEPVRAEPVRAEPVRAEPVRAEPVRAEPVRAEPVRAEPVRAEPVRAEPVRPEAVGPETGS